MTLDTFEVFIAETIYIYIYTTCHYIFILTQKYFKLHFFRLNRMFMLKNPYKYYKPLEIELLHTGESYESYCFNVYNRNVWGDDLIAAVIGDMWNIAISIVIPVHKKPVALFHNKDIPDMVLVANGSDYMSQNGSTHFSAT